MTLTDVAVDEKLCRRCGETKPVDEFHRHSRSRDGRHVACKACELIAAAEPKTTVATVDRRFLVTREPWQQDAACRGLDPDLFFPYQGGVTAPAKAVCRTCPVQLACLEYAIRIPEKFGIWGGTSERERRRIRARRRKEAVA